MNIKICGGQLLNVNRPPAKNNQGGFMPETVKVPEGLIKMILTGAGKQEIIAAYSEELYNAAMGQTDAVAIEAHDAPKA